VLTHNLPSLLHPPTKRDSKGGVGIQSKPNDYVNEKRRNEQIGLIRSFPGGSSAGKLLNTVAPKVRSEEAKCTKCKEG